MDNLSPLPVRGVVVIAAYVDAQGNAVSEVQRFKVKGVLEPQTRTIVSTRFEDSSGLRAQVEKAKVAESTQETGQ